jgi:hypothetical protein
MPPPADNRNVYASSRNYDRESKMEFEFEDSRQTLTLIGPVAYIILETGEPAPTAADFNSGEIFDNRPFPRSSLGRKRDDMF